MSNCDGCNSSTHILRSFMKRLASKLVGRERRRFRLTRLSQTSGTLARLPKPRCAAVQVANAFKGDRAGGLQPSLRTRSFLDAANRTLSNEVTMDRRQSGSKRQLLLSAEARPYVDAHDEAADFHFKRDQQAWGKLLALRERFVLRAWESPIPDRIDDRRSRRSRRRT